MNYCEPFYVSEQMAKRMGKHKEWLSGWRYLPALEDRPELPRPIQPVSTKALNDKLLQMQARINYLQNKLNQHLDNSRKRYGGAAF